MKKLLLALLLSGSIGSNFVSAMEDQTAGVEAKLQSVPDTLSEKIDALETKVGALETKLNDFLKIPEKILPLALNKLKEAGLIELSDADLPATETSEEAPDSEIEVELAETEETK